MAFEQNIVGVFRHSPWGGDTGDGDVVQWGVDWSGAVFLWQFGVPSTLAPVISLNNAAAGAQGVSASYDPNYTHPISGASGPATLIRPFITKASLEGLTYSGVADLELEHTLYVTPVGAQRRVLLHGKVTIQQGVGE